MTLTTRVWIEVVPVYSYSWQNAPEAIKPGKILKKRPLQEDRHRYLEVVIKAEQERFAPIEGVTL
jgi:hypothetical protein